MNINGLSEAFIKLHLPQLEKSGVPECFWNSLFFKLLNQVYDAGDFFQTNQLIYSGEDTTEPSWEVVVTKQGGMKAQDSNNIFLIDHAWTYEAQHAKNNLLHSEGLAVRMARLMDIPMTIEEHGIEALTDNIIKKMWKYNDTYSFASNSAEEQSPVWYIMDEFGTRIQHSGEPNFRTVPFYYHPHKCCYTLLFIIKDVEEDEEVLRNYVESPPVSDLVRDAQMLPWYPEDLTHVDPTQHEPEASFFSSSRMSESEPNPSIEVTALPTSQTIKVFTDYDQVRNHLTDPRFTHIDDIDDADIIWISKHFKDYKSLRTTPHKRINQHPMEHLLTVKDLLAVVCRRINNKNNNNKEDNQQSCGPEWLPVTYCLKRELPEFVSCFQQREKLNLNNLWIIKPWNLARGIDMTITDNLDHIMRLPATGPKIAQKYLHNPVLFHRDDLNADVKFDLRFIVMLLSVKPLKVAVYDRFWIRFGNKSFSLDNLSDYEKHFTVNNYNDNFLLQMFCQDFISKFENQYPNYCWKDIQESIYNMVKDIFIGATKYDPPRGIPHNDQCKGSYGLDIMLDWSTNAKGDKIIIPKILEANFNSDCKRACEYYPEFFNELFSVMFLDEECENVTVL